MQITPHLAFKGNCAEAFAFYAEVFGGEITFMMKHGESPMKDELPSDWSDLVIHATLNIDGALLMGADAPPQMQTPPSGTSVNMSMPDMARARRIFDALTEGGSVMMPFGKTFWSEGFGMCTDRYGQHWMINCGEAM